MAFDSFNIKSIAYKVIEHGSIFLDVMLPKNLCSGQHPINIRFHGGFLVAGSRNFGNMFPPRHLKHALDSGVIIVSPDYRLLPESNGKDILEDLQDLWTWIHNDLNDVVANMSDNQVSVDVSRIIASGESAGGYLALQLAISHGEMIKAVIASYPMLDIRSTYFNVDYSKQMGAYPQFSNSIINKHLMSLPDGLAPSSGVSPGRLELMIAIPQRGRYLEFLGQQRDLFPIERLEDIPNLASKLPRIWIYHGTADTEVPIDGSRSFTRRFLELNPNALLRYTEIQGADHGLPCEISLITTGEHAKGMEFINEALLK